MSIKALIVGFATVLAVAGIGTMATRDAEPASAGAIHTDTDAGDSRGKLSKKDFKQVKVDDEGRNGPEGSSDEVIGTKDDDDDDIEAQQDDDDDDDSKMSDTGDTGDTAGSNGGFGSADNDSGHDSGHDGDSGGDSGGHDDDSGGDDSGGDDSDG